MNILMFNTFQDIEKESWNELVSQNNVNTIFQTYEWNKAWWEIYGEGSSLFIVCVKDDNKFIGIAPLVIYRGKVKRFLKFIGHGRSDYLDFIYLRGKGKILDLIFEFIKNKSDEWDEIVLDRIPDYSPTSRSIGEICHAKGIFCLKYNTRPYVVLNITDDSGFTYKVQNKKSLIRHRNYFIKQGEYKVYHLTDRNEIMKHMEYFIKQHIERWGATRTPSLFTDQKNCNFYKKLLNMADAKWIVFTVVESKELPIAYHFGFAYNNKFIWYKPSFDISLFKRSPGEVLLKELLDFAVMNNYHELDFTIGDEAFKRRFANKTGEINSYKIFKSNILFWFYSLLGLVKNNINKTKYGNLIRDCVKHIREFY